MSGSFQFAGGGVGPQSVWVGFDPTQCYTAVNLLLEAPTFNDEEEAVLSFKQTYLDPLGIQFTDQPIGCPEDTVTIRFQFTLHSSDPHTLLVSFPAINSTDQTIDVARVFYAVATGKTFNTYLTWACASVAMSHTAVNRVRFIAGPERMTADYPVDKLLFHFEEIPGKPKSYHDLIVRTFMSTRTDIIFLPDWDSQISTSLSSGVYTISIVVMENHSQQYAINFAHFAGWMDLSGSGMYYLYDVLVDEIFPLLDTI